MKKLFVTDYVGLASRLETLPLAFMLRDYFGFEIHLDWPDLIDFNVIGSKRSKFRFHHRLSLKKILCYKHPHDLHEIQKYKNLNLRTQFGPPDYLLGKYYLPTYKRLKLNPRHVIKLVDFFNDFSDTPVVGVHIRRGDFILEKGDYYDAGSQESTSVPTWWYQHVMNEIVKINQDVKFFVSFTGKKSDYPEIFDNFDCINFNSTQKHSDNYFGHKSEGHAVCDLFALACCSLIIASPCSSFSHVAANALGNKSVAILPRKKMHKSNPGFGSMSIWGKQARSLWYDSCINNLNWDVINSSTDIPLITGPDYSWF
jgi:hypothetical protein